MVQRRYRERKKSGAPIRYDVRAETRKAALAEHESNMIAGVALQDSLDSIKSAYGVSWRTLGRWGLPVPFELQFQTKKLQEKKVSI